jgi:glycosyltransferase involved in cell wall biosynthesis
VVAFGGGAFTPAESERVCALGLRPEQVRHMDGTDSLLHRLYHQASALVYPSLYEGFGLPPLEAMARGCPVVSSKTSSMPEVVGDAGELVDPGIPESIAAGIERVVFDSDRRQSLVRSGYERYRVFSWKRCAEETRQVYRRFAG